MNAKRRSLLILWLLIVPVSVNAQVGFSPFRQDFPPEEFATRRAKVFESIGTSSIAIVQGAPSPPGYTRFRQSNEFYYLIENYSIAVRFSPVGSRIRSAWTFRRNANAANCAEENATGNNTFGVGQSLTRC